MTKKTWETPELIIIVRTQPEESVLELCKGFEVGIGPGGPGQGANICRAPGASDNWCREPGTS